jgi:hypothetical protein
MIDRTALTAHLKSKKHKQQVKKLKDAPFTQKGESAASSLWRLTKKCSEAEAAAGLGTYVRPKDLDQVPDFESVRGADKRMPVEQAME